MLKYFRAGEPLEKAQEVSERTVDGIVDWLNSDLASRGEEWV